MTKKSTTIKEEILALTDKDFKYMNEKMNNLDKKFDEKIDGLDKKFDKFDAKVDNFIDKVETTYATKQEVADVKKEIVLSKQWETQLKTARIQQWWAIIVAGISFIWTMLYLFIDK